MTDQRKLTQDYIAASTLPDTHDGQPESGAGAVPDRERLADECERDAGYIDDALAEQGDRVLIASAEAAKRIANKLAEAALALRLPVPQAVADDVEECAQILFEHVFRRLQPRLDGKHTWTTAEEATRHGFRDEAAALLRRLMPASLAAVQAAVLAEREACAQLAAEYRCAMAPFPGHSIAAAIRARSTP